MPVGPSLDHIVCQQLGQSVQPLHIRVGNATETPQTAISYSARETPFEGLGKPAEILGRLTGLFKDGALSPDSYRAVRGKSILHLVEDDLATLQRIDMSQADRRKLEAWKALLDETGGMIASSQCTAVSASRVGATQPNVSAFDALPTGSDVLTTKIIGELDGADLYSNLAVLAALCNATPVIMRDRFPLFQKKTGHKPFSKLFSRAETPLTRRHPRPAAAGTRHPGEGRAPRAR